MEQKKIKRYEEYEFNFKADDGNLNFFPEYFKGPINEHQDRKILKGECSRQCQLQLKHLQTVINTDIFNNLK